MIVSAELVQARRVVTVELPESGTGLDLFRRLGLAPDAHLLIRGETPIPMDAPLSDRERVRILAVVSGGT
jgi:sulfur carrier protein ThiS